MRVPYVRNAHVSGVCAGPCPLPGVCVFTAKAVCFPRYCSTAYNKGRRYGGRRLTPALKLSMKGNPVAQKVQVLLVDDLDGGEADETVTFALDGKTYEIDLTTANAEKLRSLLEPYVEGGRRTGGRASGGRGKARSSSGGSQDTAAIRAWAKENGYEVNDRGRVPASIREAYEKANG